MSIDYVAQFNINSLRPELSDVREKRIAEFFRIHTTLTTMYGDRYREINGILNDAKEWEKDKIQGEFTTAQKKSVVDGISQIRTDIVLFFKLLISRTEFLVNELIPLTWILRINHLIGMMFSN